MQSCLYVGTVSHRRREPVEHAFRYPLFMLYLDLDELPDVFARRLALVREPPRARAWFHREDHVGRSGDAALETPSVRRLVEERTGKAVEGPIRLLTHPRYLGYGFNPVSFYYCYDAGGDALDRDRRGDQQHAVGRAVLLRPRRLHAGSSRDETPLEFDLRRRTSTSRPSCPWRWTTTGRSRLQATTLRRAHAQPRASAATSSMPR